MHIGYNILDYSEVALQLNTSTRLPGATDYCCRRVELVELGNSLSESSRVEELDDGFSQQPW